jgi:hypothetical protein
MRRRNGTGSAACESWLSRSPTVMSACYPPANQSACWCPCDGFQTLRHHRRTRDAAPGGGRALIHETSNEALSDQIPGGPWRPTSPCKVCTVGSLRLGRPGGLRLRASSHTSHMRQGPREHSPSQMGSIRARPTVPKDLPFTGRRRSRIESFRSDTGPQFPRLPTAVRVRLGRHVG